MPFYAQRAARGAVPELRDRPVGWRWATGAVTTAGAAAGMVAHASQRAFSAGNDDCCGRLAQGYEREQGPCNQNAMEDGNHSQEGGQPRSPQPQSSGDAQATQAFGPAREWEGKFGATFDLRMRATLGEFAHEKSESGNTQYLTYTMLRFFGERPARRRGETAAEKAERKRVGHLVGTWEKRLQLARPQWADRKLYGYEEQPGGRRRIPGAAAPMQNAAAGALLYGRWADIRRTSRRAHV